MAAGDSEEHIFHSLRELLIHKLNPDDEQDVNGDASSAVGRTDSGRRYEYAMSDGDAAASSHAKDEAAMS